MTTRESASAVVLAYAKRRLGHMTRWRRDAAAVGLSLAEFTDLVGREWAATETALEGELAARNVAAPPSLPCVARTANITTTVSRWAHNLYRTTAPLPWASPTTVSTPPGGVGPTGSPTHTHQGWRATRVPRSPTLTCGGSLTGSASEFGKPPTRSSHARSRGNAGNFPQGFRPCRDSGGPW
jgi:hypothetical protein